MMKFLILAGILVCYVAATGQWEDVSTDDEHYDDVVLFSAKYINEMMRSRYHHKVVETLSVRRQVVAGLKYEVTIAVQETGCQKAEHPFEDADTCELREGSFPKYCAVTSWEKSWEDFRKVVKYTCTSKRP